MARCPLLCARMKAALAAALLFSLSAAAETMTPKAFCEAVHQRLVQFAATCEDKPEFKVEQQMLQMSVDGGDSCEMYLKDVEIDAAKVPACLAAMKTYWDADWVHLDGKAECRAAITGKVPAGQDCMYDSQCAKDTFCLTPPNAKDALSKVCSGKIKKGTPCEMGVGSTCGTDFVCVAKKCAPKGKVGAACKPTYSTCSDELTCLLKKSTDQSGKCGVPRKAGEVCHRWTECRGTCVTPNEDVKDGVCTSFCGSN